MNGQNDKLLFVMVVLPFGVIKNNNNNIAIPDRVCCESIKLERSSDD